MFLRFVGASLLSAAGPAAQVPSRIGNEIPAVLGSTRPDGSSLNSTLADGSSTLGSAGQMDDSVLSGSKGDSSLSDGSWWSPLSGGAVEGLAHASSAIVLVLLMGAALGGFLWYRRRTGLSGRRRAGAGKGWASLTPRGKQHARAQNLGRGGGQGMGGVEDDGGLDASTTEDERDRRLRAGTSGGGGGGEEQDSHELDELMRSSHAQSRQRLFDVEDEEALDAGKRRQKERRDLDEEAKVFGLGDDDEEGDASGGETDTIADKEGRRNWRS